jgi:hypothetical protein
VRAFVAQTLPDEMIPSTITVVESLPRTASGKLDRTALPALAHPASAPIVPQGDVQQNDGAPRSDTERRLAAIWSTVLGRAQIGMHDNFYKLGGHSLLVMSMMSKARQEFGLALLLRHFFSGPTIAAFARQIDAVRDEVDAATVGAQGHAAFDNVEPGEL